MVPQTNQNLSWVISKFILLLKKNEHIISLCKRELRRIRQILTLHCRSALYRIKLSKLFLYIKQLLMEHITITDSSKQLHVQKSYLDESMFSQVSLQRVSFNDVTLAGSTIVNANLSDLQVEGAQLGGARFKNIGMPPV